MAILVPEVNGSGPVSVSDPCSSNNENNVRSFIDDFQREAKSDISRASSWLNDSVPNIVTSDYILPGLDFTFNWTDFNYASELPSAFNVDGISVNIPLSAPLRDIPDVVAGALPTFTAATPTPDLPAAPAAVDTAPIPYLATNTALNLPPALVLNIPDAPPLTEINPIVISDIEFSAFAEENIDLTLASPPSASDFSYTETGYASEVDTQVKNLMGLMKDNDLGIPSTVWDQMWQHGREREDTKTAALINEIDTDLANRGFFMPQGVQLARRDMARHDSMVASNTLNREKLIEQEKDKLEMFKFYTQQAIAYDKILIDEYDNVQARALDSAKYSFNARLDLYKAEVEFINIKIAAFNHKVEVYKANLEAEVQQIEMQKLQLEAQKITSEINKDKVAVYSASIEALNTKAQVYKTQVEAAVMELEGTKLDIAKYAQDIIHYKEKIQGALNEFNIYKVQVETKGMEFSNYNSSVQAFASEVQAYKTGIDAQSAVSDAVASYNNNVTQQHDNQIKTVNAELQAKIAGLDAKVKLFTAELSKYEIMNKTAISVQQGKADAYRAAIDERKGRIDFKIQEANQKVQASTAQANLSMTRSNNVGQLYASMASAKASAANISYGFSSQASCSSSESNNNNISATI